MHPTQRKLMKRIILFLSLQFPITYPAIAGQDIDLVANVKNSTCKSGISNQGNIDLGVVGVGYFSDNVTPESYQPGGKEFTVTVSDCALMNPLMILVKIIKLRWIHILSYDQMVSRKINNQTTRCANSIFYTTLFTNSAPNYT